MTMHGDDPPEDVSVLRSQNEALDAQVKQLVKTEQRLFKYQKALDQQLRRINAVNLLALEAATAFEPRQILEIGLSTLMSNLSLDQGIACLAHDDGATMEIACVTAVEGLEFESEAKADVDRLRRFRHDLIPREATIAP